MESLHFCLHLHQLFKFIDSIILTREVSYVNITGTFSTFIDLFSFLYIICRNSIVIFVVGSGANPMDYRKTDLLVNVAKLYYEHGYNQGMIAKKLNLSRPYISKLIAEARSSGIVTIQINDPVQTESVLERDLRQRFALRRVIALPQGGDQKPLTKVGIACARYLNSIVSDGDIIGVSWGATMFAAAQNAVLRQDLSRVTVVQLCGGISNLERSIYAAEIPKLFADALSGSPYILPLPAILDDIQLKQSLLKDQNIGQVMDYAHRANIALFTMGEFGKRNALAQAGYLSGMQMGKLVQAGAVGDICSHYIDIEGKLCDLELDARTIALPLDELKKKDYRIAVAIGDQKVDSICGALRGGHVNVLITNEDTAAAVIRRLDGLAG